MRLIADPSYDHELTGWLTDRLGLAGLGGILLGCIGVLDDYDELAGVAALHNWTKHDIEVTYYGPGYLSIGLVRFIARAVVDAGCERCTLRVPRRNKRVLRALPKLGFTHEGIQRRLCGPLKADDGILFGMLRSEASRFLRGYTPEALAA